MGWTKEIPRFIPGIYAARFFNVAASLVFALWYSKLMGLEIRSLLTFILISNTLLAYTIMTFLTFRIRTSGPIQESRHMISSLILATLFSSLILVFIQSWIIGTFSKIAKTELPGNALVSIYCYLFISSLNVAASEVLSALHSLDYFIRIETAVILVQIIAFTIFFLSGELSIFVSVLNAFTLSYLLSCFSTLTLLMREDLITRPTLNDVNRLFSGYSIDYLLKISLVNLMQRFDKFLIPFFYQTTLIAQITTFSSAISLFRFVPESESRLLVHQHANGTSRTLGFAPRIVFVLGAIFTVCLSILGIYFFLGDEWVPPASAILVVAFFEILSWQYQRVFAKDHTLMKNRRVQSILKASLVCILSQAILMRFFTYSTSLLLVCLTMLAFYILITRTKAEK